MSIEICPMSLKEANAFVEQHHRHHKPVVGHKFSADIGLRMLSPRELYNAMGFPPDYIIDRAVRRRLAGGEGNGL